MHSAVNAWMSKIRRERKERKGATHITHDIGPGNSVYIRFDILFNECAECSCSKKKNYKMHGFLDRSKKRTIMEIREFSRRNVFILVSVGSNF